MFMTRSLNFTPNTTEQNLLLRSDKSESEVELTNNKRMCSMHYTVQSTKRHEAARGLSAIAELLVSKAVMSVN